MKGNSIYMDSDSSTKNVTKIDPLSFYFTDQKVPLSLSPINSDYWGNLMIMEQVVGTLIKYDSQGVYSAYISDKWYSSKDEKIWNFKIRDGLKTEDGVTIDAQSFAKNLKKVLKIYSKTYTPPTFSQLKGWKEFVSGESDLIGISVNRDNELVFEFTERPSGLLEFLSMPYFGFFSPNDFDGEKWKNEHVIHSSGAYAVSSFSTDQVILRGREGWVTFSERSPMLVEMNFSDLDSAISANRKYKLISVVDGYDHFKENFISFKSTPTVLSSFVLSPYIYPFNDIENRKAFRTLARVSAKFVEMKDQNFQKTNYFYEGFSNFELQPMELEESLQVIKKLSTKGPVRVFSFKGVSNDRQSYFQRLLEKISEISGLKFEIFSPNTGGKDWLKKAFSNKEFPIRLGGVDTGGSPENWVIDMMFCSDLGISFPDYNDQMKLIVERYKKNGFANTQQYWQAIHDRIESDAIVVPASRNGFSWMASDNIGLDRIGPSTNVPRFDLLELK